MDLRPVGVNGILAVLGDSISEQTGAQVAALREAIADAHISSVEETIPAYASLLVKYDPFLTDYAALCDRLRALEKRLSASAVQTGKIVVGITGGKDKHKVAAVRIFRLTALTAEPCRCCGGIFLPVCARSCGCCRGICTFWPK